MLNLPNTCHLSDRSEQSFTFYQLQCKQPRIFGTVSPILIQRPLQYVNSLSSFPQITTTEQTS